MIELLVTIVIMGVAFTVVVGGMSVGILGSDYNRRQANVDTVLRSSAEVVKNVPYVGECTPQPPSYTVPANSTFPATVDVVGYWNASTNEFDASCADTGLQLIRVTVTATDRPLSGTLELVKRRP